MSVAESHGPAFLTVPERHAAALSAFAKLPSDAQSKTYLIAGEVPISTRPWDLLRREINELIGTKVDAKALVAAIRGLFYVRQFEGDKTDEEFVKEAILGIQKAAAKDKPADAKELQPVVVNFLALKNLETSHHAARVRYDHPFHMHDAGIVTDVRPIFDKDGSAIEGAVISHTLKIEFAGSAEDEDSLYLAVDSSDLDKLEAAIQRARRKEIALMSFASNAKLTIVGDKT